MATKRKSTGWVAPKSGGYSASKSARSASKSTRSAISGRFVKQSTVKRNPATTVREGKPSPPKGRGSASEAKGKNK